MLCSARAGRCADRGGRAASGRERRTRTIRLRLQQFLRVHEFAELVEPDGARRRNEFSDTDVSRQTTAIRLSRADACVALHDPLSSTGASHGTFGTAGTRCTAAAGGPDRPRLADSNKVVE